MIRDAPVGGGGMLRPPNVYETTKNYEVGTLTYIGISDQIPTCNSFIVLVMGGYSKLSFW